MRRNKTEQAIIGAPGKSASQDGEEIRRLGVRRSVE